MSFSKHNLLIIFTLFILPAINLKAQKDAYLEGYVRDSIGKPIAFAHVVFLNTTIGTLTNDSGVYRLRAPADQNLTVNYSCIGYQAIQKHIFLRPGELSKVNVKLLIDVTNIQEVSVISDVERALSVSRISMKDFHQIPNPGGGIEGA
jgi:hypothetical protein